MAMACTVVRCVLGFVLACVAAAAVQVSFVLPPSGLIGANHDGLTAAGIWLLLASLHSMVFAAPFALAGLIWAERRRIRHWSYSVSVGIGIALRGLLAQLVFLGTGQPRTVLVYMLLASLAGGGLGGLVYWLAAGRRAGRTAAPVTVG